MYEASDQYLIGFYRVWKEVEVLSKRKKTTADTSKPKPPKDEQAAKLKELLNPDIVNQLKEKADNWRAEEAKLKEEARIKAEEARKAEQKRLESDFGHLLANSSLDWKKYK